ncbi:MAG: methionine synthase, partial [Alphaproteobacteria bacterium]|nr:methionine synthase [Alphaproteobacteria bacterium]
MASKIKTTVVGSYPVPAWLAAAPSEQALTDATRVVLHTQEHAGIDVICDGEMYRFDINHPETNGMIEYFVNPMGGTRSDFGRTEVETFRQQQSMGFRAKPAAVVDTELTEGSLDLLSDCVRAASVAGGPFKFTLTSPYMLARTLLDNHYGDFETMLMEVANVLADQVRGLPCACVQVDEANIPGNPED